MARYRTKLGEVEAVQFYREAWEDWDNRPRWIKEAFQKPVDETGSVFFFNGRLHVTTIDGGEVANDGEWIVRGPDGELHPWKPDIFERTFERV